MEIVQVEEGGFAWSNGAFEVVTFHCFRIREFEIFRPLHYPEISKSDDCANEHLLSNKIFPRSFRL